MEWSDEVIARLRALWDEGHSTAEIGRRLGVSKNAIIGKAHRLALPGRPSPIRPERPDKPKRRRAVARRAVGPTLPPLAGDPMVLEPQARNEPPAWGHRVRHTPPVRPRAGEPAIPAREPARPKPAASYPGPGAYRAGRQLPCCWPIGEPGTPSFRFCDAVAVPGKPYCEEHVQVAYVRVRDRRDEAA